MLNLLPTIGIQSWHGSIYEATAKANLFTQWKFYLLFEALLANLPAG